MDDAERTVIERACERLVADSAIHLNAPDYDRLALLFTEDCRWEHPNASSTWNGRDDLRTRIAPQIARHGAHGIIRYVPSLICIDVESPDRAAGLTYYTVYAHHDANPFDLPAPLNGPSGMAEWHDTYVRTPDGWRIALRRSVHLFRRG